MISRMQFRLLPLQILLVMVNVIAGIVSSLFAGNYIGSGSMSVVGLFSPVTLLITAIGMMLMGGAQILCGEHIGRGELERTEGVFTLDLIAAAVFSIALSAILAAGGPLGLTGLFTADESLQAMLRSYLPGQAIGIFPMVMGQQLSAFLSLENRTRRTTIAGISFIAVNVLLDYLFIVRLGMGMFGLAAASSIGYWVFFLVQAQYYFKKGTLLHFVPRACRLQDLLRIVKVGVPGSLSQGCQALRGIIVNALLMAYVGGDGLSAFTAANTLLSLAWAVPGGMMAVSRMLMSISIGEEDRKFLVDVFRTMFRKYIPLVCALDALIIACAVPLTELYFKDPSAPVYAMTVWGFRLLPLCMPTGVICMHFMVYGQAMGKQVFVYTLSVLDGVICVAGFTALLIPLTGVNSVYIANALNGVVTALFPFAWAAARRRRFPKNVEELLDLPASFGVPEEERMELSVRSVEEVVRIAQRVQAFCRERGLDEHRSYAAGLCLEEMAGNVVEHGFSKDAKRHTVDLRIIHKDEDLILRIKDDCTAFDPAKRLEAVQTKDAGTAIGIKTVYAIAKAVRYQNMLGLNVLTIRI